MKLSRVLAHRNLTVTQVASVTRLAKNSIYKMLRGKAVRLSTIEYLYRGLDLEPGSLRPDSELNEEEKVFGLAAPRRWTIQRVLGPWHTAPNKLSYRIAKLTHAVLPEKSARGKFYDLVHLGERQVEELQEHLLRHARVCEGVRQHPNIAVNLDVVPLGEASGWWVLDQWVEGETLEDWVGTDAGKNLDSQTLRNIGEAILEGLQHLHAAKIIFRELSPDKVWIGTDPHLVVLTDFELAKLASGVPSVSGLWHPGYFRAPEVTDYDAFPASDLYSFGKIVTWLLHGGSETPIDKTSFDELPSAVAECLKSCLLVRPSQRPRDVKGVLNKWKAWK